MGVLMDRKMTAVAQWYTPGGIRLGIRSEIDNMPAPTLLPGGHDAQDQLNSHFSEVNMAPSANNPP